MRKLSYILFVILLSGCAKTVYRPEKPRLDRDIGGIYHRIEKGETLWRIARNYGADMEEIKLYNNIENTENLQAGRVIFIPEKSYIYPSMEEGKEGFIWPAKGQVVSEFDCENGGISKGIDVSLPIGSQIRASREGTVTYADVLRGYGKVVIIDHQDGFSTIYAHNSQLLVEENGIVEKGELIAFSGNSGRCESPLLHFEIRKENIPQNPLNYLP